MVYFDERVLNGAGLKEFIEQSREVEGFEWRAVVDADAKAVGNAVAAAKKTVAKNLSKKLGVALVYEDLRARVECNPGLYRPLLPSEKVESTIASGKCEVEGTISGLPFSYALIVIARGADDQYVVQYRRRSKPLDLLRAYVEQAISGDGKLKVGVSQLESVFLNLQ